MLARAQSRVRWLVFATTVLVSPGIAQTGIEVAGHVLRRVSYGPTPGTLLQLLPLGGQTQDQRIDSFVDAQLLAAATDPSPVIPGVQLLPTNKVQNPLPTNPSWSIDNLARHNLALALYSENQLREVMVGFWQQHFNTSYYTVKAYFEDEESLPSSEAGQLAAYFEWVQNEGFRTHALGTFRDLLEVSGKGVAMTIYLDNVFNVDGAPNENYARELLELHTLGKDETGLPNLYTEADIDVAATIFTGWTIGQDLSGNWEFQFDDNEHAAGNKSLLGLPTISEDTTTTGEGDELFDQLASHQVTAEAICKKLYKFLVSQEATIPTALLNDCVNDWGVDGDISAVLGRMLKSTEMKAATYSADTVERPIEALTSTVRALEGTILTLEELNSLYQPLNGPLAQSLFRYPAPDGYSFENIEQLSSAQWLNRIVVNVKIDTNYDSSTSGGSSSTAAVDYDLIALYNAYGYPLGAQLGSEDDMVRWLFMLLHQRDYFDTSPSTEIDQAIAFVTNDENGTPLVPTLNGLLTSPTTDIPAYLERLNELARYIASIPRSFQK